MASGGAFSFRSLDVELNDIIASFLKVDVDLLLYSLQAVRYERLRLVRVIDKEEDEQGRSWHHTQLAPGDPRNYEDDPGHADSAVTREDALFRYPQISKKKAFRGSRFKGILYYPVLVRAFKRDIWDSESTYIEVAERNFFDVKNFPLSTSLQVRCMPETAIEAGIRKLLYSFYSIPAKVSDISRYRGLPAPAGPTPEESFLKAPFIPRGAATSQAWQSNLRIEPSKFWRDHLRLIEAVAAEKQPLPRTAGHFVQFEPNDDQRQALLGILPDLERTKTLVYALANEVLHPGGEAFARSLPPRRRRESAGWGLGDAGCAFVCRNYFDSYSSAMDLQTDIDNFGLTRERCFGVLAQVEAFLQQILDVENVVWTSPAYDDDGAFMYTDETTCVQEHLTWLRAQKAACVRAWSELGAVLHEHASSLLEDGASPWNV